MARRIRLHAGDLSVTARLEMPEDPGPVGIVLAHGAGVGQDHPWMVTMRTALAAGGLPTMTFNYAYTEAGRRAPDRPPKLLAVHGAALARMREYVPAVVLAGKSMGGRIASHLASTIDDAVAGLVYYGYPLVPMGKGEPRPTDHLDDLAAPQLFFAGTRDRLSPPELIEEVARRLPNARLIVLEGGDHSFRLPKSSGRSSDEVLTYVAAQTAQWVRSVVVPQLDGGGE